MPGLDFSRPLLGAGANAKSDWGSASADTGLTFTGQAQIKRGYNVEIGLSALATADANLSKFVSATARGNAFATARAGVQVQLPLNLFKEFGIVVGAQAEAQAAAGIEVGLGISVGDFIALVQRDPSAIGVPLELILLLLEEVQVQGRVEVHVAAAAMAYVTLRLSGSVIGQPGQPAGFNVRAKAGLGLAAGVGFSASAGADFLDFRRFYGRATDLVVDETLRGVRTLLSGGADDLVPPLVALAPVVKIALRTAYEIGDYVTKNAPQFSNTDAANLANHGVGIILEEAQRFIFGRMLDAALADLNRVASGSAQALGAGWDALLPERRALAEALYRMPAEPFQPTSTNGAYWGELLSAGVALAARVPTANGGDFDRAMAIAYAASELIIEATRARVNQAQAYALAIGAGAVRTAPSFGGSVAHSAPPRVKSFICAKTGAPGNRVLDYATLVQFLVDDVVIDLLRQQVPEVDCFLQIFKGPVAATEHEVIRLLLTHRHAFLRTGGRADEADPQGTLEVLVGALDAFLETTIRDHVVPEINRQIDDPTLRLYFNEVLVGTVMYTKEVAFGTVVNWQRRPVSRDDFTEALACVMTTLVGRAVILFADGFMTAVQEDMVRAVAHASTRLSAAQSPLAVLGLPDDPVTKALFGTVLNAGASLYGPLPEATRARLRSILYEAIEVLPPGQPADFLTQLGDQFFIPNADHLVELQEELLAISRDRFLRFAQVMFEAAGAMLDAALEAFLAAAGQLIADWTKRLDDALSAIRGEIDRLTRQIELLAAQAEFLFGRARHEVEQLLDTLASTTLRNKLRRKIADRVTAAAIAELRRNDLYRNLPLREVKDAAKALIEDTVHALIEGPLVDPVFAAFGAVANAADSLLDDVRELDPHQPLAGQVLDLVLDRVEDRLVDAIGGGTPHIRLAATLTFEFFGTQHVTFDVGRIDLPLGDLFDAMRDAVGALDFYDAQLNAAAGKLAQAFAKAFALDDAKARKKAAQGDHARLARIKDEQAPAERTVAILDPREQATYDRDVVARIHLGNVPASFLGVDRDEQQRVFVFLNGVLLPPKSLMLGDPIGLVRPSEHARDFTLPAAGVASNLGSIQVRGPSAGADAGGGPAHAANLAARTRRTAKPTDLAALGRSIGPGIDIEVRISLADLAPGANTLTVALLDVGGTRYVKTVAFAAAHPPKLPRRDSGIATLPIRPDANAGPAGAPKPAAGMPTAPAIAAAMGQATRYVREQSKLNVPKPGKAR